MPAVRVCRKFPTVLFTCWARRKLVARLYIGLSRQDTTVCPFHALLDEFIHPGSQRKKAFTSVDNRDSCLSVSHVTLSQSQTAVISSAKRKRLIIRWFFISAFILWQPSAACATSSQPRPATSFSCGVQEAASLREHPPSQDIYDPSSATHQHCCRAPREVVCSPPCGGWLCSGPVSAAPCCRQHRYTAQKPTKVRKLSGTMSGVRQAVGGALMMIWVLSPLRDGSATSWTQCRGQYCRRTSARSRCSSQPRSLPSPAPPPTPPAFA
jgi:hypothetical protein